MHGLSVIDPSSFSRPDLVIITDLSLNLTVSFDRNIFKGFVDLVVQKVDIAATELILDTQDLNVFEVYDTDSNSKLNYIINSSVGEFGSKLSITLPNKSAESFKIRVQYETSAKASGLQWLEPQQTAGKKFPFVFSQFQPIHARSVLPCQDTPAVKVSYKATITAPSHLTVLMSAIRQDTIVNGDFTATTFLQKVPIPVCLIAIAIGAIEGKKIGPRSTVWAEGKLIDQAAYEFGETEKHLQTAEAICGPYEWGIYDLLVLPPSFPLGGMENPCLTFVTPTALAGDRSLANIVVAHEIAHSWSGNLVTNLNWEHFWLNEGFTVFIERKIVGRLSNTEEQDFDAHCGTVELKEAISVLGADNPMTCLVVNLERTHPDDAYSLVPYEKGHTFLRYLESLVGGPSEFEPFLRKYFEHFKFKTLNSKDFKAFFENFFAKKDITKIDWDTWFYSPGMPPIIPAYNTKLLDSCNEYKTKLLSLDNSSEMNYKKDDFKKLDAKQLIQVLQDMLEADPQPIEKLKAMDQLLDLSSMENSEVKFRWLRIALKAHWEDKIQETLDWINVVGRMKFVRPLYRDLYNWQKARERAIANYNLNCHTMMHVVAYTVRKDLHLV